MQVILINIVAVAFVLGIMVLVHEVGHYAVAKLCGVRVEVFSIGFGRRLAGFRRGDTDYRISALPLGGYVKMSGENPMEQSSGDPAEFMSHPRWQRLLIAVAGPSMNILLAIALLTGVFMVHYEHPFFLDQPAVVGWVLEGSPAEKAGIQPGDKIVRVEKTQNPTWEDVSLKELLSPDQPLDVAIQRGTEIKNLTVTPVPVGPDKAGNVGWLPDQPNIVTYLDRQMPAYKAGIRPGDDIIALNDVPIRSFQAIVHYMKGNRGEPVVVTVKRDNEELKFNVIPQLREEEGQKSYKLGLLAAEPQHVDKLPFLQALNKSLESNKKNSLLIVELVQKMVRRKISVKQLEGPIGIARVSGEAARQPGWTPFVMIMSAISLNLGIFNLLPIPILDGGVILLLLIEGLIRRDINQHLKERIYQAAFVFLVLFAAMVIFNDIAKIAPGIVKYVP